MLAVSCPNCGQENINNGKLQYCSYCFARFPLDLVAETVDESPQEETPVPPETEEEPQSGSEPESPAQAPEEPEEESAQPSVEQISMYCPHCMAELAHGTVICPQCRRDTSNWL